MTKFPANSVLNTRDTPAISGALQRTCACGQHIIAGGECQACRKQRQAPLQRATIGVPPVNQTPITIATSTSVGSHFGHDFSQIPSYKHTTGTLQPKLAINTPGDEYEQEADRIADQVMAAPAHTHVATASPHIQRYSGQPSGQADTAPTSVDRVLDSSGRPLEAGLRQHMEQRFGYDFSHVRVHTGDAAEQSANDVNALAYTVQHNIVFGAGQFAPETQAGQRLIAHELTHVLQQPEIPLGAIQIGDPSASHEQEADSIAGRVVARSRHSLPPALTAVGPSAIQPRPSSVGTLRRTPDDLTSQARYPTSTERTDIQEVLNPQQHQAASQGTQVPQVTDPTGFQNDMTARLNQYIGAVLPSSQARQSSTVALGAPEIQGLGDVAQQEVQRSYGTHLRAAIHSPTEQQRRAGYQLRQHLHLVPTTQSNQTDDAAHSWVASRMLTRGADLLERYHVLAGRGARDEALFQSVGNHIFMQRTAELRTIILFHPGYEEDGEAYIQARIAPEYSGQAQQETRRRGRWRALGTTIHEMLHAVAHEDFTTGVAGLEEAGIAVEGFAEYFTAPVYENLTNRASSEDALRASIEGVSQPFQQPPDREPGSYSRYVDGVVRIRDILGGNEDSLKVAFFLGRLEYLGLRGWNEAEAARQRFPGNMLGAAALLTQDSQGFFRIDYSRVIVGRGGNFQVQLGGTINYLTEGQRLGLGANAALQYSWPDVYIRGGLGVAGSASVTQPFSNSVRLDLLPGVEAGVRIGVARVGAGATLLIPVAGGPVSERVIRVGAGLGLSVAF